MTSLVIYVHKVRNKVISDIPWAYLHADIPTEKIVVEVREIVCRHNV